MDNPIKRFQLAVQALVYTGLLSVALESGTASAQRQSPSLQPSAPVLEQPAQQPDWLLPMGGISLLAISFGIEIYRHRCFLSSVAEQTASQTLVSSSQPQVITETAPDEQGSYPAQPLGEC